LDDYEIRPVGGVQSRKIDIRLITATNRDVLKMVREGLFREDLYYRINAVTLKVPALRERKEDIILLSRHFLDKFSHEIGKQVNHINDAAMKLLMDYYWPGNVRELQNVIERAVLILDGNTIFPEHLPEGLKASRSFVSEALEKTLSIEDYTKEFIMIFQERYKEQQLADMLGITRKALWEKRKRWGLERRKEPLRVGNGGNE
jgi:transcriptional regulator with PAS, ATPase and Fis domain